MLDNKIIEESELILNSNGSVFHLHIKPENVADTVILVGDPSRVGTISGLFDKIEFKASNREFVTHTGFYKNQRITVISTGIGTDNIDIVLNELDAAVNINLKTRQIKDEKKSLNIIRIGTSGALQASLEVDKPVVSAFSIGIDGLLNFYEQSNTLRNNELENKFIEHTNWSLKLPRPYSFGASDLLLKKIAKDDLIQGITISAPGFYGPQGRILRLPIINREINEKLSAFEYSNYKITNYEMESSAIYGLSKLLGHNALAICNIIANRMKKEYSKDYKQGVEETIRLVLDRIIE